MNNKIYAQWDALADLFDIDESDAMRDIYSTTADIKTLKKAIEVAPNFWNEDVTVNGAPTQGMFLDFMEQNPQFIAEIQIVLPVRNDYRLEIIAVKALNNKKNESILNYWINRLTEEGDYLEPQEWGVQDGYIRAWWD